MRGRSPRWRWCCAVGGALSALAALAAALAWPQIFDRVLASQVALKPNSEAYREWLAPTVPIYMEVFLFNWTNADDFPKEKPRLQELGPYRFRENRRHVQVKWHPNNGSVGYRTFRSWEFDDSSNGSLDDVITTLNIIAASAAHTSRYQNFIQQKMISMSLTLFGQHMSITKTAGELLFDGYQDSMLDVAKSLPASARNGAPAMDRFGLFFGRNNTNDTDGYMEVTTGEQSGTLPGQILKWNYMDQLPYYSGKCSQLAGSAGEFMPRDLTEESRLTMFIPDLCRTVEMDYLHSGDYKGLSYHKYEVNDRTFDNSSRSPLNTCFCNGPCSWAGVMNVSACRYGSPVFISLPHFLHASPSLRTLVDGLTPSVDKHSFYFAVEPRLGVPLDVAARFQFNIYLEKNPNIALYEDVPTMLFPISWVQQWVQVDDAVLSQLRMVRVILDWGSTVCMCAVLAFGALVAIITCFGRRPVYSAPVDLAPYEKPKDEAEMKLNPLWNKAALCNP